MTEIAARRDLSALEIPTDPWTQPFWDATAEGKLLLPKCAACGTFRFPPGPFCPACHSQQVQWHPAGQGLIYSFTIIRNKNLPPTVPALIEFPEAGNLRLIAAIVDTPLDAIHIGATVKQDWATAGGVKIPVFKI